jgi:hypothetical protein
MSREIQGLFTDSVDEVLEDLLGFRVRQTIYDPLEEKGVHREELLRSLDYLNHFLDQNLGVAGKTIQKEIAQRFCEKTGRQLADIELRYSDYVEQGSQKIPQATE